MNIKGDPMNIKGDPMNIKGDPMNINGDPMVINGDPMIINGDPMNTFHFLRVFDCFCLNKCHFCSILIEFGGFIFLKNQEKCQKRHVRTWELLAKNGENEVESEFLMKIRWNLRGLVLGFWRELTLGRIFCWKKDNVNNFIPIIKISIK